MPQFVLVLLATFWAWETIRFAAEQYVGTVFATTRPVHPIIVATLPLWIYWPDWVSGLAVAGATGLLHLVVEHLMSPSNPVPLQIPRRNRHGLPPLP